MTGWWTEARAWLGPVEPGTRWSLSSGNSDIPLDQRRRYWNIRHRVEAQHEMRSGANAQPVAWFEVSRADPLALLIDPA